MKKIIIILLLMLIPHTAMAVDTLIGSFEAGCLLPQLNMQYKGRTDKVLILYDPIDPISPDGWLILPIYSSRYVIIQDGITYTLVPGAGSSITMYLTTGRTSSSLPTPRKDISKEVNYEKDINDFTVSRIIVNP
jgi:hypothetical protein